jgi:hypothetical protein
MKKQQPKIQNDPASPEPATSMPPSARNWMGSLTLVALLAIFIGFWQYSETMIGTIDRQARDLAKARERIKTLNEMLEIAGTTTTRLFNLASAGNAVRGKVFWNSLTRQAGLQIDQLPPSNVPYHLWVVTDKRPVASRPFTVSEEDTPGVWTVLTFEHGALNPDSFLVATGAQDSTQASSVLLASPAR